MDTKAIHSIHIFLSAIFLSACSDVSQSVSSLDTEQDSVTAPQPEDEVQSTLDTIIAIFTDESIVREDKKDPDTFTAAYLDSAANNLFVLPDATVDVNPYGFEKNELVTYPDSVYQVRFENLTSEIPLVYNRQVENFIELYAVRKKSLTERMFGKSILYFPYIEQALMEKNLPNELKYLTMVESALHADARSNMEAVGLWQIRYRTGKWLGLEINDFFDERKDPYASTLVAIDYLARLYNTYGNWPMALAAYNSGPGNVNKAIVRSGGSRDFWRIRPYLPAETRSYVPAFMAIIYLNHYRDAHNLRPLAPELPYKAVDTVRVYREIDFARLAAELDMQEKDLLFLIPAMIKAVVPASKAGKVLVLPLDKIAAFEAKRADALKSDRMAQVEETARILTKKEDVVPENEGLRLIEHKVRPGHTIGAISDRYGVEIDEIREWNGMRNNIVRVGQTLKIYVPGSRYGR